MDTSGCGAWCGTTTTLVLGFGCVMFVACCPLTPFLFLSSIHSPSLIPIVTSMSQTPHNQQEVGQPLPRFFQQLLPMCSLIASMCPCCTHLQHCDTHCFHTCFAPGYCVVGMLHLLFLVFVKTPLDAGFASLFFHHGSPLLSCHSSCHTNRIPATHIATFE